jgi:hypothetical protein
LKPRRSTIVIAPTKVILCAAIVAAALVAAAARPVTAAAATPCWKALLTDWYDGRIDNTYPLHCYTDAIHHLPPDVQTYSSARDDITRALQNAKAKLKKNGVKLTSTTAIPPSTNKSHQLPGTSKTSTATTETVPGLTLPTTTTSLPGRQSKGGFQKLVDKLNPSSPSSLPVPLLVLGALAILLVAAGGAGLVAKRLQGRKPSS